MEQLFAYIILPKDIYYFFFELTKITYGAILVGSVIFYTFFRERFKYMNLYILYLLFPLLVFVGKHIFFYTYLFLVEEHIELDYIKIVINTIKFIIYNLLLLISWRFFIDYKDLFSDAWIVLKQIFKLLVIVWKFLFKSKPVQPQAPMKAQYNQVNQVKSKPKQPVNKQTKPKQKRTRKPKSNGKQKLNTKEVYSSIGQKIDLYVDNNKRGGEAFVYEASDGSFAKVFHSNIDLDYKKEVVTKLQNIAFSNSIVKPLDSLYDDRKNFIGYSMERKEGVELGKLFLTKITDYFPTYNLIDTVDLAISIVKIFEEIKQNSIVVGDVNPRNILIKNKNTVFLIDCDSFQINKPSPAYMEEYRRPKYRNKNILSYRRNYKDDCFAVATIVFQLFHYGLMPYGGTDEQSLLESKYIFHSYYPDKYLVKKEVLIRAHNRLSSDLKKIFRDIFSLDKTVVISTLRKHLQTYKQILIKSTNQSKGVKK